MHSWQLAFLVQLAGISESHVDFVLKELWLCILTCLRLPEGAAQQLPLVLLTWNFLMIEVPPSRAPVILVEIIESKCTTHSYTVTRDNRWGKSHTD
jgi:hypothetical protein